MNISLPSKSSNFSGRNRHKQIIIYYDMVKEKKRYINKNFRSKKKCFGREQTDVKKMHCKRGDI